MRSDWRRSLSCSSFDCPVSPAAGVEASGLDPATTAWDELLQRVIGCLGVDLFAADGAGALAMGDVVRMDALGAESVATREEQLRRMLGRHHQLVAHGAGVLGLKFARQVVVHLQVLRCHALLERLTLLLWAVNA
eukprot:363267-Chlamydomonas_euryale.AAC.10